MQTTRRDFLKTAGQGIVAVPIATSILSSDNIVKSENSNSISSDNFNIQSDLKLNVRDFGATGDGNTRDTFSIQQALDRCWVLGGGEVIVPAGNYLTGAIALRSNTFIRLEQDASLVGTPDFSDYPIMQVRWEGKWIPGHTALIYAVDVENTGITGPGKILGNHALGGRPDKEYPLRHPALIEPIGCKKLRFEDFSTDYYLMWSIHPTYCENILFKNLTIRSTGGNGDGIDIDSCKHVLIEGCDISTGDDCIAIKSGRGMEGYKLLNTTEDVEIVDCTLADSIFACIGIGSETSGGIRNIRIKHCNFTAARTFAIYIKSRTGRGAFIEGISADDLNVSGMQAGFLRFNTLKSGLQDQDPVPGKEGIPALKNFTFTNVHVDSVPWLIDGSFIHPDKPLEGLILDNITGTCSKGITLANIKQADIKNINVTGYKDSLLGIYNVTGEGLKDAVPIEPPKVTEEIPYPDKPYHLR